MRANLLFLSCILGLSLCSTVIASPTSPLKVGIIAPLSGPVASMGTAFRQGFSLYEKEHPSCANSADLIFEDGKYDGKTTSTAFQKLISADKVDLTIVWGNTPANVIAPLAERTKSPLLALVYTPEAKGRSFVITLGPKTKLLSQKIVQEFRSWKLKTPAVVAVNLGNILEEVDYVKGDLGGNLDIHVVPTEENDFRSLLNQLRSKGVDGMLVFLLPDQAMNFAKQAAEVHFTPPMIGADIFADTQFGDTISKYIPRLAFVYSAVDPRFIERVKSSLGGGSYFFEVASGYTLGELACALGTKKEHNKTESLIDEISNFKFRDSPIVGLTLKDDEEYGRHFENDAKIYYLSDAPGS